MFLLWKYFALGFSALLPLINPLGSALIFLGLVGNAPIDAYRALARRIAINTVIFLAVVELIGSSLLGFFGISLGIMQVSGGIVIAMIGWSLLNQKDSTPSQEKTDAAEAAVPAFTGYEINRLREKAFYPFTFPITAGPGCIVVMLTLSVHATHPTVSQTIIAHLGLFLAAIVLSGGRLTGEQKVSEQYLLDLEREAFLSLCGHPKTQERMQHMLKTGKPLRN